MRLTEENGISIINWYGGKGDIQYMGELKKRLESAKKSMSNQGNVVLYDLFGGGAHVALNTTDIFDTIIYNDLDPCIYSFFKVMKDKDKKGKRESLVTYLCHVEDCIGNFARARLIVTSSLENKLKLLKDKTILNKKMKQNDTQSDDEINDIVLAAAIYIVSCWSRNSDLKTYKKYNARDWKVKIDEIKRNYSEIDSLMKKIEVRQGSYETLLREAIEKKDGVIVADPPYVASTRSKDGSNYGEEMENSEHEKFIRLVGDVELPIIICGYDNDLYQRLLVDKYGFTKQEISNNSSSVKTENRKDNIDKREYIWMKNIPEYCN
jgi:site-specific DNA-adenine methylase